MTRQLRKAEVVNQYLLACILASAFIAIASLSEESTWQHLSEQCANFDTSVQTLSTFLDFKKNFDRLNECLHMSEPPAACLTVDQTCRQSGLLYAGVKVLGQLIEKAGRGEPNCHIEFAVRIFRLHKQVADSGESSKLARPLRVFANRWAARCRRSLAKRLLDLEQRGPSALKHSLLIVNIMNIGLEKVTKLPLEMEHYVPILEEERPLDDRVSGASGLGASGFRFNTSKQIDTALKMLKLSCQTLKLYHVNLLGSLGLMASIGYALPRPLSKEPEVARSLVRRWLASAMICQVLRGVSRMTSVDKEDNVLDELLVLSPQETEVDLDSDRSKAFASLGFPEDVHGRMEMDLGGFKITDAQVYSGSGKLNSRKMELINGPSRTLADAIYTYLDLRQKDRMPMAKLILGLD